MTENNAESVQAPAPDQTAPVVQSTPANTPAEPAPTGQATFAAETPDHAVVPAGTEPAPAPAQTDAGTPVSTQGTGDVPAQNPGALTEAENVANDVAATLADAEHGDVLGLIPDIHRMVSDIHSLLSDVEPAIRKVVSEVETKGLPGLLSLFMGGGRS